MHNEQILDYHTACDNLYTYSYILKRHILMHMEKFGDKMPTLLLPFIDQLTLIEL